MDRTEDFRAGTSVPFYFGVSAFTIETSSATMHGDRNEARSFAVRFFPSGDVEALASAMVTVIENKTLPDSLARRGYEHVNQNNWDTRKKDYLALLDSLTAGSLRC